MKGKNVANVSSLLASLSAYTNPQQVTAQAVTKMITSEKTKSLIRKIIVDPVQNLVVPHIRAIGVDRAREVFNALLEIFKDDPHTLGELLNISESDISTYRQELFDESPYWPFNAWYYDKWADGDITKIFRFRDAVVYMSVKFTRADKYSSSVVLSMDFISPTKRVYEYFVDQVELAKDYIDYGYMKKYDRRVKVIQMGRGPRGFKISYATVPNTVIIASTVAGDVDQVISSVSKNDEIKEKYNVNKTIGVLLHGPAGTGKSTIVRYLAMRLGRGLILTGAYDLNNAIDYVKENRGDDKFIILIEDIDFKFVDRRKLSTNKKKSSNDSAEDVNDNSGNDDEDDGDDEGLTRSFGSDIYSKTDTLFQLLDGVLADSRILVCATTNYKDRLDPALIRDGRFDHDIEVLGLTYDDAVKVCTEFDVEPDEIELRKFPEPISPASLQTKILKYKTQERR